MRPSSTALFTLVAGLLLGGGLGFFLGHAGTVQASGNGATAAVEVGPEPVAPSHSGGPIEAADLGTVGALPVLSLTLDGTDGGDGLTAAEEARASRAAALALGRVAAVASGHDAAWTGVIRGTVVDELGALLAGVTVVSNGPQRWYSSTVTAPSTIELGRAFPGVKALEEELGEYAEGRIKGRKEMRMTVTDAAGGFTLEGLEPGTHRIHGYLEDHVVDTESIDTGAVGKLVAKRVGEFELDVRLPDGSQPDEAIVMSTDEDDDEEVAGRWTPEEPLIRFPSVKVRCRVLAGQPRKLDWRAVAAEFQSPLATLDLASDGRGPHVMQLTQQTQLRVTMKDESDALPRMDPWVRVKSVSTAGDANLELKRFRTGPFIVAGLEPGDYEVTAGRGKSAPEVTQPVEIIEGVNEVTLVLGEVDPSRFIQVRCLGPGGVPITKVDFRYRSSTAGGSSGGGASAIEKGPGEFWIDESEVVGSRQEADEVTSLNLTARTALWGELTEEVDLSSRTVAYQFEEPGDVTVEVTGPRGGALRVAITPVKGPDASNRWWRPGSKGGDVGSDGQAQIGLVQPGEYELTLATKVDEWNSSPPVVTQTVKIRSGKVRLSIAAPSLSDLVLHVPEGKIGDRVGLQKRDGDHLAGTHFGNERLDDQLRARFEGLAPGSYLVHVWGEQSPGQMEINVPCGEIVFVAEKINGLEISHVTPDKMADEAGLEQGDVVLGINEHEVNGNHFLNRFWVELGDGPSTLLILRSGRELSVELPKMEKSANAWAEFGAQLNPRAVAR